MEGPHFKKLKRKTGSEDLPTGSMGGGQGQGWEGGKSAVCVSSGAT